MEKRFEVAIVDAIAFRGFLTQKATWNSAMRMRRWNAWPIDDNSIKNGLHAQTS
jgi:hypothetical protein